MISSQETDECLMARVAAGEDGGLEPLVRRHAGPLLTFIERMLGDRHRSEEVFQEVFLAVWVHRAQYEFPRPFRAWLYGIAVNKCREQHRRQFPRVGLDENEVVQFEPSPEESAVAVETACLVAEAVQRLPFQQRVVVSLRVWDGLSYAEIAAALDRTEATVRSHMHHGLAALRRILEPRLA